MNRIYEETFIILTVICPVSHGRRPDRREPFLEE